MREVVLDGGSIYSKEELHARLAEQLGLPGHYGANLDALWDMLTGEIGLPLTIRWLHYDICSERLGEDGQRVLQLLREAEQELTGFKIIVEDTNTSE